MAVPLREKELFGTFLKNAEKFPTNIKLENIFFAASFIIICIVKS